MMIEIIPNWHPIFVHFTVGLLSISVVFYILAYLSARFNIISSIFRTELEVAARWCLWSGSLITIFTALAGFYAYNTVNHDTQSHIAMTNHRNWALTTATVAILLAAWSLWRYRKQKPLTINFIVCLLIMQALLLSTAWRGGECVYRYGLGVMDLPDAEDVADMHTHMHGDVSSPNENTNMKPMEDESSHHEH